MRSIFIIYLFISMACSNNVQVTNIDEEGIKQRIEVYTSAELVEAINKAQPGDYIFVNSGTYLLDQRIYINDSGTPENKIFLIGDITDRPLFDYTSMEENSSNQGIVLKADNWYIKGIQIYNAGDNGLHIRGNNNIIEYCSFFENADSGLQLDDGASNNHIINCDSYFNADSKLENADGFAVKMDVGSGNKFIGCRAWNNLDDGWDGYLRDMDSISTTYENCWAFRNGFTKDNVAGEGDGNGFKTGGSDSKLMKHNASYLRCLAINNLNDGFDHNSNRGEVSIIHCSVYLNGRNMGFSYKNSLEKLEIVNTIVLGEPGSLNGDSIVFQNNSWQLDSDVSSDDFMSLDINQLSAPRKSDGNLPDITFMRLSKESNLIDKGAYIGMPYNGKAPDLGAFEYKKN